MVRLYGLAVALLLKGDGRVVLAIDIQRPSSELGHYHFDRHRVADPEVTASGILDQEVPLSTQIGRHPTEGSARVPQIRRIGKSLSVSVGPCSTVVHGWSGTGAALGVRGGNAPTSTPPWSTRVLGLPRSMEKVETEEDKKRQDMQVKEAAREAMRQTREDRLERERAESSVGREVPTDREGSNDKLEGDGILMAMTAGSAPRKISPPETNRLWIDVAEGFVGGMSLTMTSLYPLFHTLRGLFGLSLLFYGQEFATLAFHIMVFRLSGWKKAAKSKDELVAYYKKARQAMTKAATDVRATAALRARNEKLKARKEQMMKEKKRLLEDGRVTAEEARAFIDKYRVEIEFIAREQEALATASSSVLAIKGALSYKKLSASLKSLYSAVVTSITASTFKRAGQLTLALTCGGLIKKTLFDLLGPVIDPIGYQIELETYIANAMRGPANLYISLVGFATSALMFFHFFVDPRQALTITFVFLGARVVTDYIVAGLNPVRGRFGVSKRIEHMPLSAVIYLSLVSLGFGFQQNAGVIGDYVCRPFIAFLGILNNMLNHFQMSTISYFS